MTEDEMVQALEELQERIEGMEISLEPPEESQSTFTVFESAGAERQMIVHFIAAEDYGLSPPNSRSQAQSSFLTVIEKHKENQNHSITHGDLMVLKGNTCNYYCYVAKVDRYDGSGFQDADTTGAAVSEAYGERKLHELIIWTETYPGDGANAGFEVSSMTITSDSDDPSTITLNELTLTPDPKDPVEGELLKTKFTPGEGVLYQDIKVNEVKPGEINIGDTIDAVIFSLKKASDTAVTGSSRSFNTSQAYFEDPDDEADDEFYFDAQKTVITDGTETPLSLTSGSASIEAIPCYSEDAVVDPSLEEWDPSMEALYGAGDVVKVTDDDGNVVTYEATQAAWWDRSAAGQVTYNNGTQPTSWCQGEQPTVNAGDIVYCGDEYARALKDDPIAASQGGVVGVDYEFISTPVNLNPSFPDDKNLWVRIKTPMVGGEEIPCPPDEFSMFDMSWRSTGSLTENTYQFGAPKKKDPPYPPVPDPELTTVPPIKANIEYEPDEDKSDYYDLIDGCLEIKISKEETSRTSPITLLGAVPSSSESGGEGEEAPPSVTITPTENPDGVDYTTLVPDRHPEEEEFAGDPSDFGPNEKKLLKVAKTEVEWVGEPDDDGTPYEVIESIDGASLKYTPTSGDPDTYDLILREEVVPDTPPEPTTVPVLKEVTDSDCGGCYVAEVGGNLKLSTKRYKGKKQTISIATQNATLELTGKKLKLTKQLQKSLIRNKGDYYSAVTQPKTYKVELEGALYDFEKVSHDTSVSIYGQNKIRFEYGEGDLKVSLFQESIPEIYKIKTDTFEFDGKKLSIATQPGEWYGDKFDITATTSDYLITNNLRTDTVKTKVVTFEQPDGKKITVVPGVAKIAIDYQYTHYLEKRKTILEFSDKYTFDLTPFETMLYFSKTHKLDIYSDQAKLHIEEAKRLKLIPKEYTLEQYKVDLEYIQKEIAIQKKRVDIGATECQTASVSQTDLGSDSIDIWEATAKPQSPIPNEYLWSTEVSLGEKVNIAKDLYFDWIDVSIGTPTDPLYLKGVSLGNYKYEPPPENITINYADLTTNPNTSYEDDSLEFDYNKITYETIDKAGPYAVYSTQYTKGPETSQSATISSTSIHVPEEGDPTTIPADSLYVRLSDDSSAPDYDNITTSYYVFDRYGEQIYESGKVTTGRLTKYGTETPCEDSDKIPTSEIDISPSGSALAETSFVIPVEVYDDGSKSLDDVENDGPEVPIVKIDPHDGSDISILPETNVGTSTIITAGEAGDLPEWEEATVEYEQSSSSERLYIPKLSKCPINNDTIYGWSDTQAGFKTTCTLDDDGLFIQQEIELQQWDVNCGVISDKAESVTTWNLPSVQLTTTKLYTQAITFCEYDSEGNASTKTIDVLTTTAPSDSSVAAGHMITGCG
jgi:hypothetical protein